MMFETKSIENVIKYTRLSVTPILCWPPPMGSSTSVVRRHNLLWWIPYLISFWNFATLFHTFTKYTEDIKFIIKVFAEICAIGSTLTKMIICRIQQPRMQVLMAQMEAFVAQASPEERELFLVYINKCNWIYVLTMIGGVGGCLSFVVGPAVTSQMFPASAIFPFPIETTELWLFLYIVQSCSVMCVTCMVNVDVMFALLLWYAGARFEMLANELRSAKCADDIKRCVEKHNELIIFAEELKQVVRLVAAVVTGMTMMAAITGGFVLIGKPDPMELPKFGFMVGVAATELYLYTWPADHLIETNKKVGNAVYESDWVGGSVGMLKDVQIIIHRSQFPTQICIRGLLPNLSLEFYGSTMTATLSYFTTLRAVTAGIN